jgi:hypothetical protein
MHGIAVPLTIIHIKSNKMKHILIGYSIVTVLMACNNNTDKTTDTAVKDTVKAIQSQPVQDTTRIFPAKEIIADYLEIKNALAKDNSNEAAAAAKKITNVLATLDPASLPAKQGKIYGDIQDELKEHAEHIGTNGGKIAHQREHFIMLSDVMDELVKGFGNGGQALYKDFCPMANDGKGATWLSEIKEIRNPYYGSKMSTCGSVKEVIK